MSKSLGNSPDPLDLIARYGADGVRMGILLSAPAGNDILYDDALCEQGRNFCNKIWNCFRLVKGWEVKDMQQPGYARLATDWFASKLAETDAEVADLFSKYRLSEALMTIYKLYTDEFSSWFLEMVKPAYGQPIDKTTYELTLSYFDRLLRLLHPFMPFITEELWQNLADRKDGESIMVAPLNSSLEAGKVAADKKKAIDAALLSCVEQMKNVIAGVRTIRLQKNIAPKEPLELQIVGSKTLGNEQDAVIAKLCNLSAIHCVCEKANDAVSFLCGTTEFAVPLANFINVDEEISKLEADLRYQEGFLAVVMKKLGNERFVQNAKPEIVALEQKKKADAEQRIKAIKASLESLRK